MKHSLLFYFALIFLSLPLCAQISSELIYTLNEDEEVLRYEAVTYCTNNKLACALIIDCKDGYKVVSNNYDSGLFDSVRFTVHAEHYSNSIGTFMSINSESKDLHFIGYDRVFKDVDFASCQITPSGKLAVREQRDMDNTTKQFFYYDSITIGPISTSDDIIVHEYAPDRYYFKYIPEKSYVLNANGKDIYTHPGFAIPFKVYNFKEEGEDYSFDIECYYKNESFQYRNGKISEPYGLYEIDNWGYAKKPVQDKDGKKKIFYKGKTYGPFMECSEPKTYRNGKLAFAFMENENNTYIYMDGDTLGPFYGKLHYYKSKFEISANGKIFFLVTQKLGGYDEGTSAIINENTYNGPYDVNLTYHNFYYVLEKGNKKQLFHNGELIKVADSFSGILLDKNRIIYAYQKNGKWKGMVDDATIFESKFGPWETKSGMFTYFDSASNYTYINGYKGLYGKDFSRVRWQHYPDYVISHKNKETGLTQIIAKGTMIYEGLIHDLQYFDETDSYSWIAIEGKEIKQYIYKIIQ